MNRKSESEYEFSMPRETAREAPEALRRAYESHGFIVLREFLTASERGRLASEIDRYIRDVVPHAPPGDVFYHDPARPETLKQMHRLDVDPFFRTLMSDSIWKGTAEILLGEVAEALSPEWFNKPPGTDHPTPPHQDNFYFQFRPPQALTMWLALDDVDEENGCLRYIAGSHANGLRQHEPSRKVGFSQQISDLTEQDQADEEKILLKRGDLVCHHCETIHRAEANQSARPRRAFAMVFRGRNVQRDQEAFQEYLAALRQNS